MNIKGKDEPRWVLVGKVLEGCADRGFKVPPSKGSAFLKLIELDAKVPIIRHKTKKQINRVQIYESLWKEHSSKLISYFYNNNENQKLLRESIYKEFPSYPKAQYFPSEDNIDLFVMNTENVIAAITEILSYSCSEKKITHRTSKSKNNKKNDYSKDETYVAMLKMHTLSEAGKLSEDFFLDVHITEYVEMFFPNVIEKINDLQATFTQDPKEVFDVKLLTFIKELEFISKRDDLLRERVTDAADSELRLYLSDKVLIAEVNDDSNTPQDPEYLKYKRTTGLKMKSFVQDFEDKYPLFNIERMDFIQAAILDLNNILKCTRSEKPIREYREISKHIRAYRNSKSSYVFTKPFKKRIRKGHNN